MKRAVFIFLLCCSKLFSQVGPPDLRCLSVAQNGDVTLTWLLPSDPSHQFVAYDIYFSATASSYLLCGTVNTYSTTTFVHTTTLSTVQSLYYYIITRSGTAGTFSSVPSDTLHTIRLNIQALGGAPDLKILYNDIHQPHLSSTATTYTINKEYPVGTWSTFAVTPDIKYADTLSVCNAHISYQITLQDNSGCTSSSNMISGVYTDTNRPGGSTGPLVDSISVLPDGSTTLAWRVPRDMDIIKYQIYYRATPTATIGTTAYVYGRLSTSYTYTIPAALTQPVALFVAAIDSCSDSPGIFNPSPITMYLQTQYDHCAYKTFLHWNAYQGMRDGILEYRIYYSANGGSYTQVGTSQDTTFTHTAIVPGQNAGYYVRVFNTSRTITASSNRTSFFAGQVPSPGFVYIRTATVADKNSVLLKLFVDTTQTCRGIDVFRSADNQNFSNIGFIPFNKQQPLIEFTDANARTQSQSYLYKALIQDDCGNVRTESNHVRTIYLKVADDQENIFTKHLSWNAYQGFGGGVSGYTIYRIINEVTPGSPIGSAVANATTYVDDVEDAAPQGARVEYLVEAHEGSNNPYGFSENSNSNTAAVYMEGAIYIPNAFAPHGHNTTWRPVTHFIDKTEYSVMVFNRWGHMVFETHSDEEAWDGNNCLPDVYAYLIKYKTSTGEYKEIKGTVLMLQ